MLFLYKNYNNLITVKEKTPGLSGTEIGKNGEKYKILHRRLESC